MSALSRQTLELISSWSEVLGAVFGILAATSVVVYVLANKPLRAIEARENLQLRTDLENATATARSKQAELEVEQQKTAKAQEEAAKAQTVLAQSLTRFARRSGHRIADFGKLVDAFKDKPKKTLEIRYKADDTEAENFSHDIDRAFQHIGWTVSVRPLKAGETLGGMALDELKGTTVFSRKAEEERAFVMPFLQASPFGGQAIGTTAPELPDDMLVIVLGVREKL